jgi:dCTP deaminase
MSIKSDKWIRRMAEQHGMIEPFEPGQVRTAADGHRIVSYGTSSYGYDIRCAPEFKVFTNIHSTVVDPKNFDENSFVDINKDVCVIPPNSFALARTVEYFRIPRNVLTICLGKSTYARCGIIVNVTPFEPEWEGYVTLEFSNTTPLPAKIYAGEGCAQVLFFESDEVCETSYKDRGGKYQGQRGVTCPRPELAPGPAKTSRIDQGPNGPGLEDAGMKWEGEERSSNVEDRRGQGGGGGMPRIGGPWHRPGQHRHRTGGGLDLRHQPAHRAGPAQRGWHGSAAGSAGSRRPGQGTPGRRQGRHVCLHRAARHRAGLGQADAGLRQQLPRAAPGALPRRHAHRLRHRRQRHGALLLPRRQAQVYLDLDFFDTLSRRMGAPGDFAQAYVIAHEVGHHLQNLMGITGKVDGMRGRVSEQQMNALSVRVELQADCLAGVWAHHSQKGKGWLDAGDIQEGMNAASQIGDDTLQKASRGRVVPESFTHGSSQQRMTWFKRGLDGGSVNQCNTFDAKM